LIAVTPSGAHPKFAPKCRLGAKFQALPFFIGPGLSFLYGPPCRIDDRQDARDYFPERL
jgi:hypothetical protein